MPQQCGFAGTIETGNDHKGSLQNAQINILNAERTVGEAMTEVVDFNDVHITGYGLRDSGCPARDGCDSEC